MFLWWWQWSLKIIQHCIILSLESVEFYQPLWYCNAGMLDVGLGFEVSFFDLGLVAVALTSWLRALRQFIFKKWCCILVSLLVFVAHEKWKVAVLCFKLCVCGLLYVCGILRWKYVDLFIHGPWPCASGSTVLDRMNNRDIKLLPCSWHYYEHPLSVAWAKSMFANVIFFYGRLMLRPRLMEVCETFTFGGPWVWIEKLLLGLFPGPP